MKYYVQTPYTNGTALKNLALARTIANDYAAKTGLEARVVTATGVVKHVANKDKG